MAVATAYNLVSFNTGTERVWLTLQSDWTIRGGLAPSINTATAPYTEVAKLGSTASNIIGSIEFWYSDDGTGSPDVVRQNVWLVDAKPLGLGRVDGDEVVYEFALTFADHRIAFVEPRGGRLFAGIVNPDPLGGATLKTVEDLMAMCRTAMGDTGGVPGSVNTAEPPRDLEWNGAHAPTELENLLQLAGHCYAPQSNGFGAIVRIGTGTIPTVPVDRLIRDVASLIVDRRPAKVILSSVPTAVARTFDEAAGAAAPTWEFVIQDPDDEMRWKPIGALSFDALDQLKKGFPDVDEKYRKHVDEQLYRCIRLNTTDYPPRVSALLREVLYPDGTRDEPHLLAEIAIEENGAIVQREQRVPVARIEEGNVLVFEHRLGRLPSGVTQAATLDPVFVPLTTGQLLPTFTVEGCDSGDKEFAAFGFSSVLGSLATMSSSTAKAHLTGYRPETAILCDPDLRVVYLNDDTNNRDAMEARAESRAEAMIAADDESRTISVKGFFAAELSGRVSEIRYSQGSLQTSLVIDGWAAPSGGSAGSAGDGGTAGGGGKMRSSGGASLASQSSRSVEQADRRQRTVAARRGTGSSRPDVAIVSRTPDTGTKQRRVSVEVQSKITGQAGRYMAKSRSGKLVLDATGNLAADNVGTLAADSDCVVWYLPDIRLGKHTLQVSGSPRPVLRGDYSGAIDEATSKPIVVVDDAGSDVVVVDLEKTGGSGGNATTAPSWVYTLKRHGETLATGKQPVAQRAVGLHKFATLGLAIVANDGEIKLLICDEVPDTGGC